MSIRYRDYDDELSRCYGDGEPANSFYHSTPVWSEMAVRAAIVKAQQELRRAYKQRLTGQAQNAGK